MPTCKYFCLGLNFVLIPLHPFKTRESGVKIKKLKKDMKNPPILLLLGKNLEFRGIFQRIWGFRGDVGESSASVCTAKAKRD